MQFFPKLRASYLFGKAIMRFHQKRYNDSARLLEKVGRLDSHYEQKELYYSYLGRNYLALGRYDDALEFLSSAYELFKKQDKIEIDGEYIQFLRAFSKVLEMTGKLDRSKEVLHEAENCKISEKK